MTQVSVQDALRLAQKHRDAGRFRDVESIYRDILSRSSRSNRDPVTTRRPTGGRLIYNPLFIRVPPIELPLKSRSRRIGPAEARQ